MSCPTCDHTLECIGDSDGTRHFHCPRCGTYVQECDDGRREVSVPKLVERCRKLQALAVKQYPVSLTSFRLEGVTESINVPGERPK